MPTLRRPRYRDRRQAGYRLGRVLGDCISSPWPDGIFTRWMTNEVSWSHRNPSNPNRPAVPGRTDRPMRALWSSAPHGVGRELLAQGQLDEPLFTLTSEEGPRTRKQDRHISDKESDHVAILREDTVERETDSESGTRISSIVNRPVAETEKFNDSGSGGY